MKEKGNQGFKSIGRCIIHTNKIIQSKWNTDKAQKEKRIKGSPNKIPKNNTKKATTLESIQLHNKHCNKQVEREE